MRIQEIQTWHHYSRYSFFMSSVTFVFTASTDSNLVPFNADLIFGNKKSHMELGQVSTVDVPARWSCASSKKSWQTGHCVPAHCLGEEPRAVLPHFRLSSHPFTKVCQNLLVVDLVKGLTFRHPIHVNNPSDVRKNDHHCFKFGLAAVLSFALVKWGSSSAWIGT